MEELLQRRKKPEEARARTFTEAPSSVTFVDYDDVHELRKAMEVHAPHSVSQISPNDWVDCGPAVFVLTGPNSSYIRLSKEGREWQAYFYSPNHKFWRDYKYRGKADGAPLFRRTVAVTRDFAHAVRGCDTFMAQVCKAKHTSPLWLRRKAKWRAAPASAKSRAALAKALQGSHASAVELPGAMTQGVVLRSLARLRHGGRAAWVSAMKKHNKALAKQAPVVQVGPLPR